MPDFTDPAQFPAFYELPSDAEIANAPAEGLAGAAWWMLAQVKVNMTLTKPTLIVTDRRGLDFAVTFEDSSMDLKGYRKGYTMVVPRAQRTDREEGKKAVMRIEAKDCKSVQVIPAKMAQLLELGQVLDMMSADDGAEGKVQKCAACGKTEGSLARCTGCGTVRYCSKTCEQECQLKGWSELGHKSNCKSLKAIKTIWPS
ncbi:glycosyl hydrolase family 76 [Apiospora kogelbergensis]|uniref:Glycosyl hydrolase family 76 n=1 Tax=Apiospora kogelbergensis TaxID=1337665 RepID=A0AAW0Q393_9PEZI